MPRAAAAKSKPVTGPRYQEYMPLSELRGNLRNPKAHDLPTLRASMGRFGYVEVVTRDERTGLLVSGHGRVDTLKAERDAGASPPEGIIERDGEWFVPVNRGWASEDDDEANDFLITANETTIAPGWDNVKLAELLSETAARDSFDGTGFNAEKYQALLDELSASTEAAGGQGSPASDGSLLSLADVTFGEPSHTVHDGEVYRINRGDVAHWLVIADVMTGWPVWSQYLKDAALFVPYPGPYAPLSRKAEQLAMVLVQPDHFLAGHLLDKYEAVAGADAIERVVDA